MLFDLFADLDAAEFFSMMATVAYSERERELTGKKPFARPPIPDAQVAEVIDA